MKRLTIRNSDGRAGFAGSGSPTENTLRIPMMLDRLAEYEDAEEQGLLVRLPCKVGDRVYFLDICHTAEDFGKKFVSWGEVTKVSIAGMYVCLKTLTELPLALSWESIFTTREAAEKALEDA